MLPRTARAMLLLLAVVLAPQLAAVERRSAPCLPGRWLVESPLPSRSPPIESITLGADRELTLSSCEARHTRVHSTRRVTHVHAHLICPDHRRFEFSAEIEAPECSLHARVKGVRQRPLKLTAQRSSCGDGVLDVAGGEQCDASAAGGDVPCPDSCGEPSSATPCGCTVIETAPHELAAQIAGPEVLMHWTPPDPASGLSEVRILRRLNEPPTDANDPLATLVFVGGADDANDAMSALLPDVAGSPHIYHYAAFGCLPGGSSCETTGSRTVVAPTLTQALQAGGYVIHWRHASADVCNDFGFYGPASTTDHPGWWKSCERDCTIAVARQLSEAGMHEATVIGQELRARNIPFGRVITSEYCRCFQTADLMALGPVPEQNPLISFFVYENERCRDSYELINQVPAPGTNTALIGHTGFGNNCAVLETLLWGEGAVFKPDGHGNAEFITRLLWDQWSALP